MSRLGAFARIYAFLFGDEQTGPTRLSRFVDWLRHGEAAPDAVVIGCPCGQHNRVRVADFGRGPICGKCRRRLMLPS